MLKTDINNEIRDVNVNGDIDTMITFYESQYHEEGVVEDDNDGDAYDDHHIELFERLQSNDHPLYQLLVSPNA
jgi:hypothetical protein